MGIQINGQTDTISAADGGVIVSGYELSGPSNINVTGVVTATTFNGALSGTATTATNLADAANITTGTINSARLSGNYNINVTGNVNSSGVSTFSNGIVVSAGTTSAPSISPSGDSNTGIFFPSADTVCIAEGGAEALRVDSSGNVTVSTGNLIIGTSGKGIDFSATANSSGTMSSELLNDYEEGTWTPSVGGDATYTYREGRYTKIGRLVDISFYMIISNIGTGSNSQISGLPFTPLADTGGSAFSYWTALSVSVASLLGYIYGTSSVIYIYSNTGASTGLVTNNVLGNNSAVQGHFQYYV